MRASPLRPPLRPLGTGAATTDLVSALAVARERELQRRSAPPPAEAPMPTAVAPMLDASIAGGDGVDVLKDAQILGLRIGAKLYMFSKGVDEVEGTLFYAAKAVVAAARAKAGKVAAEERVVVEAQMDKGGKLVLTASPVVDGERKIDVRLVAMSGTSTTSESVVAVGDLAWQL